ncbi:MAG: hypothetical protein IJ661_00410 [Lachnospiraceae bacterium]|nr:hypothetical protein [Lachnospiraceae bacterium]
MFEMDKDFKKWLTENKYGNYNGVEITPTSRLVRYTFVVSLVVITHRSESRYYFEDVEKSKASKAKLFSTLGSLLLGWWGIPWGPIWTIKAVIDNMANSDEIIWGSLAGEKEGDYNNESDNADRTLAELNAGVAAEKRKKKIALVIAVIVILLILFFPLIYFLLFNIFERLFV